MTEANVNPLPDLPRPPNMPPSLYEPTVMTPTPALPESPYFERDILLDPPDMPQAGWFADVEADVLKAHFKNRLTETVPIGSAPPTTVHAAGADLDWTVSPRIEVGYRFASGFGELAVGYRSFFADGAQDVVTVDGTATARSVLAFDILDFDYSSRKLSLGPAWEMKWTLGERNAWTYYAARNVEGLATAAAGSGLVRQRESNGFCGFGPHGGVELARHLGDSGWSLLMKVDAAGLIGWLRQDFRVRDTTGAIVEVRDTRVTDVPALHGEVGLDWRSTWGSRRWRFFGGYEYEYWWDIGRMDTSISNSRADMNNQGFVLRAGFNY